MRVVVGLAFSVFMAVTIVGCGDKPPQQQPHPLTPEPIHPALEGAVTALKNASTFGFVERSRDSDHLPLPEFGEVGFKATGNYQSPDRFTKRVLVRELGHLPAIHMRSISIGDERYAGDPATEEWMLFHDDLGLKKIYKESLFRNPVVLFSDVLSEGGPYEYQGIIILDDVSVHHFVSTTRKSKKVTTEGTLRIEIWVSVEDLLPRKMTRHHSWTVIPCEPDQVCPDILVFPGSERIGLQFSFPGDETPIVAPPVKEADTVQSPFGPMALFKNVHVPFSIRYPAAWKRDLYTLGWRLAVFRDYEEPARRRLSITTEFMDEVGFRAGYSSCFEESVEEFQVPWCNTVKHIDSLLTEGALEAEDYTDFSLAVPRKLGGLAFRRSDFEVMSRQRFESRSGSSSETLDIGFDARKWPDTSAGRRLTYVQEMPTDHPECDAESRHCYAVINVNYVDLTGELESLKELADHSFGTIRVP